MENKYHIYLHIKLTDGSPFYVGKGIMNGYRSKTKQYRSEWWHRIVDKYGFDIIILEENLTCSEACVREIYWIDRIGRRDLGKGPLVNLTIGGDGRVGYKMSDDQKRKISNSLKGIKRSPEFGKQVSQRQMGLNNPKHKNKI